MRRCRSAYTRHGQLSAEAWLKLIIERLREYDAEVVESTPAELPSAIKAQLAASGRHCFVAPEGLSGEWLAEGFDWKIDRNLATAEIEQAKGVRHRRLVPASRISGTIVLHHSAGRRQARGDVAARLAPYHSPRQPGGGGRCPSTSNRCQQHPGLINMDLRPALRRTLK